MGKTAKIILSVIGVFVLACVVGAVLFARFAKQKFAEGVHEVQRQQTEARAWAGTHSQGDCMDEGMARVQRCATLMCPSEVQIFTDVCLSAAAPTAGLCEGVPSPADFTATSQWINARCTAFTSPQSAPSPAAMHCRNLITVLQRHCALGPAAPAAPPAPVMPAVPAAPAP